jgi:hypothetical protein
MAPTPTASTPNDIDAIALALAGIDDLLRELDETLRNFQPPRRISPDQRATLQARIDRTIAAIDDIVRSTSVKGRSLLAGDGRIVLTADPATPPYQLRSIAPRALGGSRSRLFDIGSGEAPRSPWNADSSKPLRNGRRPFPTAPPASPLRTVPPPRRPLRIWIWSWPRVS